MFKLKEKRAETYIGTIITVFLSLIVIAISMSLFNIIYTYQKVDEAASSIIKVAAVQGRVCSSEQTEEISEFQNNVNDIIENSNLDIQNVSYSFEGSDTIIKNTEEGPVDTNTVQYGDKIKFSIRTEQGIGFVNDAGFIRIPISLSKVAISEKYYKE